MKDMINILSAKGNTTLEVILSLIIFAFVAASVAIALPMASENNLGWRDRLDVSRYLEGKLEENRHLTYDKLTVGDTGLVSETLPNGMEYQFRRQTSFVTEGTNADLQPTWVEVSNPDETEQLPKQTWISVFNPDTRLSISGLLITFPPLLESMVASGLAGLYFNDLSFNGVTASRLETVDFNWGANPPAPGIDAHTFSTRWTGFVIPKYSGNYTFYTTSDDGARLWVDHQLLINNWNDHPSTENTATQQLYLEANRKYPLTMDFYENQGVAIAQLLWRSPSTAKQVIDKTDLSPAYSPCEDAYINQQNRNRNYGDSNDLGLSYSGNRSHAYLKFNIAGITGKTITAVKLRLYSKKAGDTRFEIRKTTGNWAETSLTWNNPPSVGSAVYGNFSNAIAARTFIDVNLNPSILDSGDGIYGIALIATGGNNNLLFSSREDLDADADVDLDDHGPRLIIESTGNSSDPTADISVLYACRETSDHTNTLRPWFKIVNHGTQPVNLSLLKIRYWYTANLTFAAQNFRTDWAGMEEGYTMLNITGLVTHRFEELNPDLTNADRFVEIGFDSTIHLLEPGKSAELQNRIFTNGWVPYTQLNDYSFNPEITDYQMNSLVTVYYNGLLIFGVEPD